MQCLYEMVRGFIADVYKRQLLHSFLKTWGEFLRRLLALAKRRRMWDYDAVTLSAALSLIHI